MIQPILLTADLPGLQHFYTELFAATETDRVPADGPAFFQGLTLAGGSLGLVADDGAPQDPGQRILLSIDVDDVDQVLGRVAAAGGEVLGPANDMPWGQRVGHIKDPDGNSVNLTAPVR